MEKVCREQQKSYRAFLVFLIAAAVVASGIYYIYSIRNMIPDTLNLNQNSVEKINFNLPFVGTVERREVTERVQVSSEDMSGEELLEISMPAYGTNVTAVNVDLLDTINISTGRSGSYQFEFKLFGIFPIKKVQVNVCEETLVIPCGIPVGIYIETQGVMVVDIGDITMSDGTTKSPASGIIWPGDYIVSVDGVSVTDKMELVAEINKSGSTGDGFAVIELYRSGELMRIRLKPACDKNGDYKIGIWVRDDCQGLGTLTYIDSKGGFGALGHGISDVDTGKLVQTKGGRLYCAKIWSIVKGRSGAPGEVVGSINYDPGYYLGHIDDNTEIGIYGVCDENIYQYIDSYAMEVGYKQEITQGKAYVRSFIDGSIRDYEIYITNVDISNNNLNKGISFVVTDQELLETTGGIIQGMSGSPIIQNNKVIGAVTHVLVNDAAKGYGIFIETMMSH